MHQQFIHGGIGKAVCRLLEIEKGKISILSFSIGGTIAWKYCLKSKNVESLYCISSTRLRYELERPTTSIFLFYGKNDTFKPNCEWFKMMKLNYNIIEGEEHNVYMKKTFVTHFLEPIVPK